MNPLQSRLRRNNTTLEKKDNKEECSLDNFFLTANILLKRPDLLTRWTKTG
jgi:hypothetical protein